MNFIDPAFHCRTKLVSIKPQEDGSLLLKKYDGRQNKGIAELTVDEETTLDGILDTIEDFRSF